MMNLISLIVAHDPNRVIGLNNDLPWHIPEDLAYFKKMTMGKSMVMGRKTFDSIGRPLPGRQSIVITRNEEYAKEGVIVVHGLSEALEEAKKYSAEVMIIGGSEIFSHALDIAGRLYITYIHTEFDGDTLFPAYNQDWKVLSSSEKLVSENGTPFTYLIYERK